MSDAAVVTFIDIRARDAASSEFKKVSQEAKKAAADVGTSFKNDATAAIKDGIKEIRSYASAFGLIILAKKVLIPLIEDWLRVQKETANARKELEFYFATRGASGALRQEIQDTSRALAEQLGVEEKVAASILILGDRYGFASDQSKRLAAEALALGKEFAAYKNEPLKAFNDLAQAELGFGEQLSKTTGLDISTGERRLALHKQLLAVQKEMQAANLTPFGADIGETPNPAFKQDLDRIRELREEAAILRREAGSIPALDPLRDEKQKRSRDDLRDAMREYNIELRNARNEERLLDEQRRIALKEQQHNVQMVEDSARQLGAAMGDAFAAIVTGAKSGKEAFAEFGREVARIISRLIAEFIALAIFRAIAGVGGNLGGAITRGVNSAGYGGGIGSPLPSSGGGGGPRALPGSFGAGINAGGGTTVNNYINTIDAKSFEAYLSQSQGHLAKLGMDSLQRDATFRRAFGAQGKVR